MLNKRQSAVLLGLIFSAITVSPVQAETNQSPDLTAAPQVIPATTSISQSTSQAASVPATISSKSGAKGDSHLISKLPHRIALFTAGVVVGTPVAIIRQTKNESISGVTDLVGTNRNPLILLPAAVISLPFGIMSGIFGGPTTTTYRSLKHCGDDTITKETLGISVPK